MDRVRLICIAVWLLTAFALVGAGTPYPSTAQAQTAEHHAGVVIQFADGSTSRYCVSFGEDSISGLVALLKTGLDVKVEGYGGMGALVCQIGPEGCNYPEQPCVCQSYGPGGVYWSYYHLDSGKWKSSNVGAGSYRVKDGDVEGWAWSSGKPPSLIPSLDQICSSAGLQPTNTLLPPASTKAPPTAIPLTGIATVTATKRPASSTPTHRAGSQDKQAPGVLSVLPQPANTAVPTLAATSAATPTGKSGGAPLPQPTVAVKTTSVLSSPTVVLSSSTVAAQPTADQKTPARVAKPTLTKGANSSPTVGAPPTNVVTSPQPVPTVDTRLFQGTATPIPTQAVSGTIPTNNFPAITPTIAINLESAATATTITTPISLPSIGAALTATSTSSITQSISATPGTQPPSGSDTLARNIALVIGAGTLAGLGLWAAMRRRRGADQRGGRGVE